MKINKEKNLPEAQTASLDAIWACLSVWVMVGGSSGNWVMNWRERDIVVVDSGGDCKRCVRVEFKRILKMKCKNESKNDYFCKQGDGLIFQEWSFFGSFSPSFFKNGSKMGLKMSEKWVKNGYCEWP